MSLDDVALRNALVGVGLLRCDDLDALRIYSYTQRCSRARAWNDLTLASRGHIFNLDTGECVARPLPKFFAVGECPDFEEQFLPWERVERIAEKVDGFLGVLYRRPGHGFAVATRGSFHTAAAEWATENVQTRGLRTLPDDVTLCLEIVHPMTRVVVDYGGREDLVLLAAFNRHTGREYDWPHLQAWSMEYGFSLPELYAGPLDELRSILMAADGTRTEGYVISFRGDPETGAPPFRLKVKTADYLVRAHAQMTARRFLL